MKHILFATCLFFIGLSSSTAQTTESIVKWTVNTECLGSDSVKLTWEANIAPGWHLYSQFIELGGPIPTHIGILNAPSVVKPASETTPSVEVYDKNFDMTIKYFSGKAQFVQVLQRLPDNANFKAEVEFMVCDDSRCLPPTIQNFDIPVICK